MTDTSIPRWDGDETAATGALIPLLISELEASSTSLVDPVDVYISLSEVTPDPHLGRQLSEYVLCAEAPIVFFWSTLLCIHVQILHAEALSQRERSELSGLMLDCWERYRSGSEAWSGTREGQLSASETG